MMVDNNEQNQTEPVIFPVNQPKAKPTKPAAEPAASGTGTPQPQQPGTNQPKPKKKLTRKAIIIIVVLALLLLGGAAGGGYVLYRHLTSDRDANKNDDITTKNGKKIYDAKHLDFNDDSKVISYARSGQDDVKKQIIEHYKQLADKENDKAKKAGILLNAAGLINTPSGYLEYDKESLKVAVQLALEAESIQPSINSASTISTIYQNMGDTKNYEKWNKIFGERYNAKGYDVQK